MPSLHNSLTPLISAIREAFRPVSSMDGRLNVHHIALASQGYWLQSRILRIPDEYGFFSSGPAPLQEFQGAIATCTCVSLCVSCLVEIFTLVMTGLHRGLLPVVKLAACFAALRMFVLVIVWVAVLYDVRRAPDFNWEKSNLRQE